MKRTIGAIGATLAAAVSLSACGGHSVDAGMVSKPQVLDTNGVLELAKNTSATATPFPVNDGALEISDTSETSEPVSLNGM